jgi:phosphonoacetaldehyde dehydrogenase
VLYGPERQGALFAPVVLDHVDYRSELVMQETFGPPIPIIRCTDLDDVDRQGQRHRLRAVVRGVHQPLRPRPDADRVLRVGTVNIWEVPGYRIEMSPFGGIKDSGNGIKEGVVEAMKYYTNVKTYSLPWPRPRGRTSRIRSSRARS